MAIKKYLRQEILKMFENSFFNLFSNDYYLVLNSKEEMYRKITQIIFIQINLHKFTKIIF